MPNLFSTNPSQNNKIIGEINITTPKEIEEKVKKAHNASKNWADIGISKRIEYLKEIYDAIDKRKDEISTLASSEMGFPIKDQKMFDIGDGLNYFKWYLENAEEILSQEITHEDENEIHKIYFEPYGVSAVIQPWNFPFCQWSWAVLPQLFAGNTVVFKHSEECPLTGKLIEEIVDSTSLPKGVFSEVYGNGRVGEELLKQDINLIAFTGSVNVGKKIYEIGANKFIKVLLELGGSAPGIVFEDADLEEAIEHIFAVRFTNNGQACDGLKRLIVHESVFDEVVQLLSKLLKTKTIGDPLNETTDFGPLVAKRQVKKLESQLQDALDKEAKIESQLKVSTKLKGAYFPPTILTNIKQSMRVWKEEVFGPLLPIISFKTNKEAVDLANGTEFGLGGYIYSSDQEKSESVAKKIETGMVSINGTNYVMPFNPFGGYKMSGLGREHSKHGLRELCQMKVVSKNK